MSRSQPMRTEGAHPSPGQVRRRGVVAAAKRIGPLVWQGARYDQPSVRHESQAAIGSLPSDAAFSAPTKHEGDTPTLASGTANASPGGALQSRMTAGAGLILLVAVAVGLFGQGAYYAPVQRSVGALVAAATVLALAAWPPTRSDVRLLPVAPAVALAAWAALDAALHGVPAASVGLALLLLAVVAVLLVCRRIGREDRDALFIGVTGIGLGVALAGWLGVAGRVGAWAFQAQGVWRASSLLSYPNATAAVLAPVALLVLARLVDRPRSLPLALALVGLCAGLTLAAVMARLRWRSAVALLLAGALAGGLALVALGGRGAGEAIRTVAEARINLASPDRGAALRAALRATAEHPVVGAGPGLADLRWKEPDGGIHFFAYAHNEYAQLAAQLGLVGLTLLAVLLLAIARVLWSARPTGPSEALWAGVVAAMAAFAVHSGFDFVWHLPAVVLTVMLLLGAVLPAPHCARCPHAVRHRSRKGGR